MIKKFTRVVLTVVIPIGLIAGCGTAEKTEAKERLQYEVGYMDDNKLIGIDETIEDCIILDNKDEASHIWKQIERGSIIEVQYGKDRNDIVGVQLVGDRKPYEISDKFDRNTINEIVGQVKGNL
ncbi:hypothetical protein AB2553_26130 [Bacillus mycoides]|uniref:hypothetical protein n=1 Tax=Bacillus mycoides TaxID=1405 RepID=UPI003464159F